MHITPSSSETCRTCRAFSSPNMTPLARVGINIGPGCASPYAASPMPDSLPLCRCGLAACHSTNGTRAIPSAQESEPECRDIAPLPRHNHELSEGVPRSTAARSRYVRPRLVSHPPKADLRRHHRSTVNIRSRQLSAAERPAASIPGGKRERLGHRQRDTMPKRHGRGQSL